MGGGGAQTTNVVTNLIPAYAQPYAEAYLSRASAAVGAYDGDYYASTLNPTYAPRGVDETDGIAAIAALGTTEFLSVTKGRTIVTNNFLGAYINANPMLTTAFQKRVEALLQVFDEETLPGIGTQFAMAGCYGGSVHNAQLSKAAEGLMAKLVEIGYEIYGVDFYEERRRQEASMPHAINLAQESAKRPELRRKAGLFDREFRQGKLVDNVKQWMEIELEKVESVDILGNGIKAMIGAGSTNTTPYYIPSQWAQVAGFAMTGLGIWGMAQPPKPVGAA